MTYMYVRTTTLRVHRHDVHVRTYHEVWSGRQALTLDDFAKAKVTVSVPLVPVIVAAPAQVKHLQHVRDVVTLTIQAPATRAQHVRDVHDAPKQAPATRAAVSRAVVA